MNHDHDTGRIRSLPVLVVLAITIAFAGCSEVGLNDILGGEGEAQVQLPSTAQVQLDLPLSLAPSNTGAVTSMSGASSVPVCQGEDFPGAAFACITRFVFSEIGIGFSSLIGAMLQEVAAKIADQGIPSGITVTVEDGDQLITIWWTGGDNGTEYRLEFYDATTEEKMASWRWAITSDGGANGEFIMLEAALLAPGEAAQDVPDGLRYQFSANADGSEKWIRMEMDLGDSPPAADASAPTALILDATKSSGNWTVMYGLYSPTWISDEVPGGVESVVLVSAVGGTVDDSPAVMKVVALAGNSTSVPPSAEDDNALCDYLVPIFEQSGEIPPGLVTCGDNNPFYIPSGGGAIQEGGSVPPGSEALDTLLSATGWVVTNPQALKTLTITF